MFSSGHSLIYESLRFKEKGSIFVHLSEHCPGGSVPGNGILVVIEVAYFRSDDFLRVPIELAY